MRVSDRFLNYVKIYTASALDVEETPSTACQFDLSRKLAAELREIGMSEVYEDEHAYVYAVLPASAGYEDKPCMGLIAHIDVVPDFPAENVRPQLHPNYDGGDIHLGPTGRGLSPKTFPRLKKLVGQTLITTDGTTVLGADDKAGVAEIMTACETIIKNDLPHGKIAV